MAHHEQPPLKAILFDLMGTCTNWKSSLLPSLHSAPSIPGLEPSKLADEWRAGFFAEIQGRFERGERGENFDVTMRRVLDGLLEGRGIGVESWDGEIRRNLVEGWHGQIGWPDAGPALERLRGKYFIVVLANGTTRLQLDIAKSSGLPFHMLFSSQLLGFTKPDPQIYKKALELMKVGPGEAMMVAAHIYDLPPARSVGMRTAYVQRETEDLGVDMEDVKTKVDLFFDGKGGGVGCGLGELADYLGA